MNQEAGGREQTKGKATKLGRARPRGQNCTAMAQLRPWRSSAGQQQISQLTLIIDNLI